MKQITKETEKFLKQIDMVTNNIEINTIAEDFIKNILDAEFSSIWYYDEKNFKLFREREKHFKREVSLNIKKGIIYKCFMTKENKLYNYLASDKDYVASVDNPDDIKIKSKIMYPLLDNGNFIGIITVYNSIKHNKKFSKNDMQILKELSPYIINVIYKMQKTVEKQSEIVQPTAQEAAQEEHVQTTDDTLTFVSNFVHDIRTPANSLYGFLDLLDTQITDERLKTYIANAKESASFINELTTSVLNVVSTHKESVVSEVKEVDSVKFFSAIAESFSSNMNAKNICFNIYIDPMLPKNIIVDTLKMKRVILNLISNAYKFTPNHKFIEFSVKYIVKTNVVLICIKDTGIGIPKDKQKGIFEAFKQAEDTTALNFGGTGLGLFISAKYVKEMGGTLDLVSEIDKGSTFSFEIPLNITDETPFYIPIENKSIKIALIMDNANQFSANNIAKHIVRIGIPKENIKAINSFDQLDNNISHIVVFQNKLDTELLNKEIKKGLRIIIVEEDFLSIDSKTLHANCDVISQYGFVTNKLYKFLNQTRQPKVLIVDDDTVSVMLIETILENEFCVTTVARDGREALDTIIESYIDEIPFDIVYIDNNMPFMNGATVMENIRKYEMENKLKPIIAISTSGEACNSKKDCELYDIVLGKPFKKEQIIEALYY